MSSTSPPAAPFAVVVLAAGGSSRMGRAKQLLPYLGKTLVEHAARVALASGASEVVVVAGAHASEVREALSRLKVRVIVNPDWEQGMGGSIARGVAALSGSIETVVIALGDQPQIPPQHLRDLASQGKPVVASSYDGIVGAPAAFARSEFSRLLALSGETGARHLLRSGDTPPFIIEFARAKVDIDTPEDYRALVPEPLTVPPTQGHDEPDDARAPPPSHIS